MTTNAKRPAVDGQGREDPVRGAATLSVIEPGVPRDEVDADGRVGAVAYPYRAYRGRATISPPLLDDRVEEYVVTVDRSRRLTLRADTFPEPVTRTVDDVLVLPAEVSPAQCDELAEDAVFKWTLRKFAVGSTPDIAVEDPIDVYKLFWIVEREGRDVIVDSVDGTERALED
ncbi:MAG: hypothetical protein ACQEQY_01250 [Halobacteriota archaeon]